MSKYLIAILLPISIGFVLWLQADNSNAPQTAEVIEQVVHEPQKVSVDTSTVDDHDTDTLAADTEALNDAAEINNEQTNNQNKLLEINNKETDDQAYREVAYQNIKDKLWIALNDEQIKDKLFVAYDPQIIEDRDIGDSFVFPATGFYSQRTGVIHSVHDIDEDIKQWEGNFENNQSFRVTRSLKDNYTLAIINTDSGSYEMEIKNGIGWIRSSSVSSGIDHIDENNHDSHSN